MGLRSNTKIIIGKVLSTTKQLVRQCSLILIIDQKFLLHRDTCFNQFNYIVKCTILHKKGINFTRPI